MSSLNKIHLEELKNFLLLKEKNEDENTFKIEIKEAKLESRLFLEMFNYDKEGEKRNTPKSDFCIKLLRCEYEKISSNQLIRLIRADSLSSTNSFEM